MPLENLSAPSMQMMPPQGLVIKKETNVELDPFARRPTRSRLVLPVKVEEKQSDEPEHEKPSRLLAVSLS